MKKIKNIVFDLGGVIMNLDVPRTIKAFKELGITNIVNNTGHNYQHSFFYELEVGKISEDTFLESLLKLSSKSPSYLEIKKAWNQMILDMPKDRVDFLHDIKKTYNIFLLSNTNGIHQKKYLDDFKDDYKTSFNKIFKKAYYSHEIGIRKPDVEIFNYILNDSNLKAEETLFMDDSFSNIEGAQKAGIKTFHVQNYNTIDVLKLLNE
ncbi:putative hydrolase of the HAD superfamily [Polaribacter sp. KT25b]|uniref:HAD family hydrolase n=1 Tax=Polaribacter sp. KT25b TaxID=1855336 RepID=UPI00087BF9D2|nr:HAD family phosphatase [Polaribacter sp. KT25b]SDS46910.1 putative hydrolase of the HAD superfamily [Polaribacter sp. KT25b]